MKHQTRQLRGVADALAIAAGWALFTLAVLVGIEVVGRKFFAYSLKGVDEIGGYVLAVASTVGFIYGLVCNAHIRVDILITRLGPRTQAVLHLVAFCALAIFSMLFAWRAIAVLWRSWDLESVAPTPLATPLVLPQGLWAVCLVGFAGAAVAAVVQIVLTVWRSGPVVAASRFSPISAQEEVRLEVEDFERRSVSAPTQTTS